EEWPRSGPRSACAGVRAEPGLPRASVAHRAWKGQSSSGPVIEMSRGASHGPGAGRPTRVITRAVVNRAALAVWMALGVTAGSVAMGIADDGVNRPHMFAPVSTPAFEIREIALFVIGVTAVIFLIVAGLIAFSIVRFRHRQGEPDR